jgi:hypothetical protein
VVSIYLAYKALDLTPSTSEKRGLKVKGICHTPYSCQKNKTKQTNKKNPESILAKNNIIQSL